MDEDSRLVSKNWFGNLFGISEGDKIAGKGYFGVWLAHTGFGLPLAIFQFLWTLNDMLVALVFLIDSSGNTTMMR